MLLVLSREELERLVTKYSTKRPKIEFLGENSLKIKISGVSISLFLEEVLPRKLSFIYKMSSFVNFFVDKFVNLEKPGIVLDKESARISIDFEQLVQDKNLAQFYIKQLLIDTEKLVLSFDMSEMPEVTEM